MKKPVKSSKSTAQRLSISLPKNLAIALDSMIEERGFQNRSQAISEIIQQSLIDHQQKDDNTVMAGTITLFYNSMKPGIQLKLSQIAREHIEEVISSQHVLLEGGHVMEVMLVQGPVKKLRKITDQILTCKGVASGRLTLTNKILPQLHSH